MTGVTAARIERLARELAEQRPGGRGHRRRAARADQRAVPRARRQRAERAARAASASRAGLSFTPQLDARLSPQVSNVNRASLYAEILAGDSRNGPVLLLDGPIRCSRRRPAGACATRSLKVPFIASFGSFLDDTSVLADLILPDHSFLESWIDGAPGVGRDRSPSRPSPGRR